MQLDFIDPGKLRTPLELQEFNDSSDGQGGITRSYSALATIFAHISPISANRYERGHGDQVSISHQIIIRYRQDIEPDQRFIKNSRIFTIQSIHDPDETQRYLICKCLER